MSRQNTIALSESYFDSGEFFDVLSQRVAIKSESQNRDDFQPLHAYLMDIMIPELEAMGFTTRIMPNPVTDEESPGSWPFLVAERIEDVAYTTLLTYGHGDVVLGYDEQWYEGLSPWKLTKSGERWYGRGAADNKAQHTINLAALNSVLKTKDGKLGYNVKVLIETGEEVGSPGLAEFCELHKDILKSDLFIASDGPRLDSTSPTVFLGSRGGYNFDLTVKLREGAHHSGNWGGLLSNAGTRLAHAWASMVDAKGRILVPSLLPEGLPDTVREALKGIQVGQDANNPDIDLAWGEPELTPAEQVFGWNTLEMLTCKTGNPDNPVNAIPGFAKAHCQIRFVVGTDSEHFLTNIRKHLDQHGFDDVIVEQNGEPMQATRLNPNDPWVGWALASLEKTTHKKPTLLPNLGGSIPNHVFSDILGLPTVWVPHSYPACSQHAPNEHVLAPVCREALQIMTGLFWDLAEQGEHIKQSRNAA
ncbi:M20 family metallopeptidase [Marinomonas mediterranea]|jgi:Acetylornithine deacetylase/Succinyl-diaminopimelate desuccinylase and related deacylases|uniref:Peptidase M20 n=1 Tax=Marinomonas mediterranea (strain ATCC 700492 / JCM 21426 / NBRC 103028 / MMB-1) TaxID=717774 RepID=F2K332_MARM1|nr:M20 family metallopeptidase [Marinomonas mediterranea]ADZ90085.1 peptidase M20 [Marinomonas mediterranea MMB-1]WCN16290.1 M20/M25/M40 family metallo-hydrolase [Marinomonas mediterranea MMB-1]